MNPLTRKASRSELREMAMDYAAVLIGGLLIAVLMAGGV
jgi:hypothetical protein